MAPRKLKIDPTDPRLQGHETVYSSSRGGWVKPTEKPTPGKPKKG
ncbi:hypothetical protein [Streptomyces cinereoruber]